MITDAQMHAAWDRVARTEDGHTIYLHLMRRLMAISTADSGGALRLDQGERTFAAKLIGLMATGIRESGGRNTSTDGSGGISPDQPITFAVAGPRAVSGPARGTRRRGPFAYPEPDTGADED